LTQKVPIFTTKCNLETYKLALFLFVNSVTYTMPP